MNKIYTDDIPKIGFQMLFEADGISGRLIEKAQKRMGYSDADAKWTHVGTYSGKGKISEAVFPVNKENQIRNKYFGRTCRIVSLKFPNSLVLKHYMSKGRYHIALASNSRLNLKYGALSLLWWQTQIFSMVNWLVDLKLPFAGQYCSVKEAFSIVEEYPAYFAGLNKPLENIVPADFANESLFEPVWEGVIQ